LPDWVVRECGLRTVPSDRFIAAFRAMDEDGDGELSHREFQQVMAVMRAEHTQGRQVRDKNLLGTSLGRLEAGGQLEAFFGEDGREQLICGNVRILLVRTVRVPSPCWRAVLGFPGVFDPQEPRSCLPKSLRNTSGKCR
jgi:hypothetical protein